MHYFCSQTVSALFLLSALPIAVDAETIDFGCFSYRHLHYGASFRRHTSMRTDQSTMGSNH